MLTENTQENLTRVIQNHINLDTAFKQVKQFVDAKTAMKELLHQNGLTYVRFDMYTVEETGDCGAETYYEYRVQFPDLGILVTLYIRANEISFLSPGYLYYYYFKLESVEQENPAEDKEGYTLTFEEAIRACLQKKGFIRGDRYRPGIYVANRNNVLVMVSAKQQTHTPLENMMIYDGALTQKYKLFSVANAKELEM